LKIFYLFHFKGGENNLGLRLPRKKKYVFVVRAKRIGPPGIEGSFAAIPAFGGSKEFESVNVTVRNFFRSWAKREALSVAKKKLPKSDGWYGHWIAY
jgi:hypothetical protein